MSFVHLHTHTEYSVLDGLATVEQYVARAKQLRQPALAITDHGVLAGAPHFYRACRDSDIEPIIGQEFYFVPRLEDARTLAAAQRQATAEGNEPDKARHHLIVLAKGLRGYQVLSELSTEGHKNFYYKPLIDRNILESLSYTDLQHLYVLSGCAASRLSQLVLTDSPEQAEELLWWRDVMPNFYIELQDHGTGWDKKLNKGLLRLAVKYNVPWVITNDPHYALEEDACYHDTLLAIQTASDLDDSNRFRFDGEGYHLRSKDEIRSAFSSYPAKVAKAGMRSTLEIARECHTRIPAWEQRVWQIPRFPDAEDAFEELKAQSIRGLKERGKSDDKVYRERLKHELRVIRDTGIADFLLITGDSIRWAREQGIPVGPGRGSVCGTLVGYCIGIHNVDPIRYGLLFERFLNPARPSMPDIDTDFGQLRRGELFSYVEQKYGQENVVRVCAYQHMNLRGTFKSLAKAHGISWEEANRISSQIPNKIQGSWRDPNEGVGEALEALVEREEALKERPDMMDQLWRMAGVKRAYSTHAAGVLIADPKLNIRTLVPEMRVSSGGMVGQFDLAAAELMGLMKQDFLGLRTLDTIQQCIELVAARTEKVLQPDNWVPDEEPEDDLVYKMLGTGRTAGVFQMEGRANTRGIQDIQPICFEDIVSCTALYRTGPILAGFPEAFLANREAGAENIPYLHPLLIPILSPTWGVILYQEQVMEMGLKLANFTMEQVDDLKDAIKKKKSAKMDELQPYWMEGCAANGISEGVAAEIWSQIEGYSGYAFNRSHAVAYSMISYQTARLKHLYPLEFYCALLRTVDTSSPTGKEKRASYFREAVEAGIKILPGDINISDHYARPDYEHRGIRFGFCDYKGIGESTANKILEARPEGGWQTAEDVEAALTPALFNKLWQGSALRSLGLKGSRRTTEELLQWIFHDVVRPWREMHKKKIKNPRPQGGRVCIVGQLVDKVRSVTSNGNPYQTWTLRTDPAHTYKLRVWDSAWELYDTPLHSVLMVRGAWEPRWGSIAISETKQVEVLQEGKKRRAKE